MVGSLINAESVCQLGKHLQGLSLGTLLWAPHTAPASARAEGQRAPPAPTGLTRSASNGLH